MSVIDIKVPLNVVVQDDGSVVLSFPTRSIQTRCVVNSEGVVLTSVSPKEGRD